MNADGTGLVPLTDFALPASNFSPSWSPDGSKIAFTSTRGGPRRAEIWLMNADGTNLIKLTAAVQIFDDPSGPFFSNDETPSWSPDGTKIVFSSDRDGIANHDIYLINADGSNLIRLTNNPAEDRVPGWSPDGQHISFSSLGGGRNGIYVIDIDGANDRQITSSGFHSAWSPDGQRLAISDFDPQAAFALAIYLTDNNGNNRIKLTNNGRTDSAAPTWQRIGGPPAPPPPPPTVYSVTGQVVDSGPFDVGAGVPGITVSLSGSVSAVTTTDADGKFRFAGLPQSGTFTLTPSTSNWGLSPSNQTFITPSPCEGFSGRNFDVIFFAAPIYLQFSSATFSTNEGSSAIITIVRQGFVLGTSTIEYATSNGTAVAGTDYIATSGTLQFNPSDSVKSIAIPIIYDKTPEPGETINLTLSNPTGSVSRGRQTATLTINDPPPALVAEGFTSQAGALNEQTWLRDPFPLRTSFLGQTSPTRVVLFAHFIDLVPGEDASAVVVTGRDSQQLVHQLPVESVVPARLLGTLPDDDSLTQITVTLPGDLPPGDLFINVTFRGLTGFPLRIRIK
jgi:hypothetical protein